MKRAMRRWAIDVVVISLGMFIVLRTAIPGEIPGCGVWWRQHQSTFSCSDHDVSTVTLARFPYLHALLLENVTLVRSPTYGTIVSEGLISAAHDDGRDLTSVGYLGAESMNVPEWLMQRLPNLKTLTLTNASFDFSWLRYAPSLKRLFVARMTVPSALPLARLATLEEVDLVVVPNASEIERELRTMRPAIMVKVVRN